MATSLQLLLLNSVARSDYTAANGARPECAEDTQTFLFIDEIGQDCGYIGKAAASGVVGSATRDGLVDVVEVPGEDNVIMLTDKGFAEWLAAYPKDEGGVGETYITGEIG